jgi:putative hydrolase of the HAD superfamily
VPVRAVLFDIDDTLIDHTYVALQVARAVQASHASLSRVSLDQLVDASMSHMNEMHPAVVTGRLSIEQARVERYRRLLAQFGAPVQGAENLADLHVCAYAEHERLLPGCRLLLKRLSALGIGLAAISNNARAIQERRLARHAIARYFSAVVVSADHGMAKPDPQLFQIALDALGASARETVCVGDSWHEDVQGARRAGITPVWLNRRHQQIDPTDTVRELADFEDLDGALHAILDRSEGL